MVWGGPKPEGVGLGFSSSLPVLPGVGVALRLAPSLRPPPPTPKPTPVRPPSAEFSPAVCRLHSPGALAPVQGGPGWLQRQESQGLRPARPSPVSPGCPSTSPQQTQDLLSPTGGLLQGALPDGPCFPWAHLTLVCSQSLNSENRATLSFSLGRLRVDMTTLLPLLRSPLLLLLSSPLSEPQLPVYKMGFILSSSQPLGWAPSWGC